MPTVPISNEAPGGAALQHGHWRNRMHLSSGLEGVEAFLTRAGFDRAPWLAVGFAAGIAAWFVLDNAWQWLALIAACLAVLLGALAVLQPEGRFPYLRQALISMAVMIALGCGCVWIKSALIGTPAISRPLSAELNGTILSREEQPAQQRVRLLLATREPGTRRAIRVRLNLDSADDRADLVDGAQVRLRARLMPPAPPMLPGGYDFARAAWFSGLAATGSVQGKVQIIAPGKQSGLFAKLRRSLSEHIRGNLAGSPGTIASALASGDRGAIAEPDDEAMRDSGLTHLLSVSGLHVSAVVAAAYVLALRLLGLWQWLALRVKLPLAAAGAGALTGVLYTLLTGAEVPTVRSCIGAVLVLLALALGREALSMRMVAVAAFVVLLFWPEALVGPSFQMSFAAVLAIVALHGAAPLRSFLAPREEGWWIRFARHLAMLLLTGVVIELALLPIGLFHFHRAGVYGALANVIAIPLTTFISMPLIALALVLDSVGLGAPAWWLAGKSLELLLVLAHFTAAQPGAVSTLPALGTGSIALFVTGGLWLALWRGWVRLLGLVPAGLGGLSLLFLQPPDVLVSSDGRHLGITGETGDDLLVLREGRSDFARDNLLEIAGMAGSTQLLEDWPGAQCSRDICIVTLQRGGRDWRLLVSRSRDMVEERALAAACERVDIVIADRYLPYSCKPAWFKADRDFLAHHGGLAINLAQGEVRSVAQGQGAHGWWRVPEPRPRSKRKPATPLVVAP